MLKFDAPGAAEARFSLIGAVLGSVWVTLSLRIWIRMRQTFTWADGFCLLSALLFTGFCTITILIEIFHSKQYNDASHGPWANSLSIAGSELYLFAMAIFKISVALFYLKYIEGIWQRCTTYAAVLVNTASSSLVIVVTPLECGALPGTQPTQFPTCTSANVVRNVELATNIANAVTSWALAIVPIFIIASRAQRMSTILKVCTGCVVLLGGCVGVMSLVRVIFTIRGSIDLVRYLVPLSVLECGTAIIAASAATFLPLFRRRSTPAVSGYIAHTPREKNMDAGDETLVYECVAPSKSHFSMLSEASFRPKTWFRGLNDNAKSESASEDDSRGRRNKGGSSLRQKPARGANIGKLVVSHPTMAAIPQPPPPPPPPPLNRTESQQRLLQNKSELEPSMAASRRHAGSPSLFLMYEGR